jgi:hypothetical protein
MAQSFNLTAQINLQAPSNLKTVVAQIRREFATVSADIKVNISSQSAKSIDNVRSRIDAMNASLIQARNNTNALDASLRNLSSSLSSLSSNTGKVDSSFAKTSNSVGQTAKNIKVATTEMEEFGKQSALAIRRFAAFSVVTSGVFALINAVNSGFKAFVEFDKELIRLQQVTGKGEIGLRSLEKEITNLSISLGVSSKSLISVASTLAQAGLSADETRTALAALAKTELAPSFDNLTDTTEGAIAAIRQFGLEAKDLEKALGSINAVAAAFAVESKDIISAIQRTGGVFAASSRGVSEGTDALNEFIAVFTSIRQTTRESAETIATGLRTIFTRIQRAKTIDQLKEYGVELTDLEGKFVGPYEAVKRLSAALSQLDPRDLRFSSIVEELGGFRQIGKVIPLIQQFKTAQDALAVAQKGQGSLYDAQVTAQKSLANQLAKVREQFLALIRDVGKSQSFQALFKIVTGLASGLISLASAFKPILPILAIMGAVKGVSAIRQFGSGFMGGISKGGGARGVGSNIGESLSGAKDKERDDTTARASDAIRENTSALKLLTDATNKLSTSVIKLDDSIRSRPSGTAGLNSGGIVRKFARGGLVPGSGNGDTVPAMLEPGEFVIRKKAVETLGASSLHKMNKYALGGIVQKFAAGGAAYARSKRARNEEIRRKAWASEAPVIIDINDKNIQASHVGRNLGSLYPEEVSEYVGMPIGKGQRSKKFDAQQTAASGMTASEVFKLGLPARANQYLKTGKPGVMSGSLIDWIRNNSSLLFRGRGVIPTSALQVEPQMFADSFADALRSSDKIVLMDPDVSNAFDKVKSQLNSKYLESKSGKVDLFSRPKDQERQQIRHEGFDIAKISKRFLEGGIIQKLSSGGTVEDLAQSQNISIEQAILSQIKAVGGISGVRKILGISGADRTPNSLLQAANIKAGKNLPQATDMINAVLKKLQDEGTIQSQAIQAATKVAIVGLQPFDKKSTEGPLDLGGKNALIHIRGLPSRYADAVSQVRNSIDSATSQFAENMQNIDIFGGAEPLAFDFDETLVSGADIFGPDGKPDIAKYSDLNAVADSLKNGKLTPLGQKLKTLLKLNPNFKNKTRILTARPQSTAALLADKLQQLGLPYFTSDITGVSTGLGSNIAQAKADNLGSLEKLIDDNITNINTTRASGKSAYAYTEPKSLSDKQKNASGMANIEGAALELVLAKLGAVGGTIQNRAVDFENGLGPQAAQVFDIKPNWPTEVKRTLSSGSIGKAKEEFSRYFQEKSKRFALGGQVYDLQKGTGLSNPKYDKALKHFAKGGKTQKNNRLQNERIIVDDNKVMEARQAQLDMQQVKSSFSSMLSRDQLFAQMANFSKIIGVPDQALTSVLPKVIDFDFPKNSIMARYPGHAASFDKTGAGNFGAMEGSGSGGRGAISFRTDGINIASLNNKTLYHELTHQLLHSLREKEAKSFDVYKNIVNNLFDNDNDKVADAIDALPGNHYTSADIAYGRRYKISSIDNILRQAISGKAEDKLDKQQYGDMLDIKKKAEETKMAKQFKPINPAINTLLRLKKDQNTIDHLEDMSKEEFLTTLVENIPSLDSHLSSILDNTLSQVMGAAGITRQKFAKGGSAQDTVPALLTPGEFVINKKAAQRIGYGKLNRINKADKLKGYNKGGAVQYFASGSSGSGVEPVGPTGVSEKTLQNILKVLVAQEKNTRTQGGQKLINTIEETIGKQASGAIDASEAIVDVAAGIRKLAIESRGSGNEDRAQSLKRVFNALDKLQQGRGGSSLLDATNARVGIDTAKPTVETAPAPETPESGPSPSEPDSPSKPTPVNPKILAEEQQYMKEKAQKAGMSVGGYKYSMAQKLGKNQFNVEREIKLGRQETKSLAIGKQRELKGVDIDAATAEGATSDEAKRVQDIISQFASKLQEADPSLGAGEARKAAIDLAKGLSEGKQSVGEIIEANEQLNQSINGNIDANKVMEESVRRTALEMGESAEMIQANVSQKQVKQQAFINSDEGKRFGPLAEFAPDMLSKFSRSKAGKAVGGAADFISGKGGKFSQAFGKVGGIAGIGTGAAVAADQAKQFLPVSMQKDPNVQGALGALGGAGSGAASGAMLGAQVAGPVGALVAGVGGAIIGGIQGFFDAKNTTILTNTLDKLSKSTSDLDQAFKQLDNNLPDGKQKASEAFGRVQQSSKELDKIALTTNTFSNYLSRPSDAQQSEALGARIANASKSQQSAERLASNTLASSSTNELDSILKSVKEGGTGALNPIVEEYKKGAVAAAEAANGTKNLTSAQKTSIEARATERASLDAYMKSRKEAGATDQQISDEIKLNKKNVLKQGQEIIRVDAEVIAKQQLLVRATKEVAVATENLLDVYRRINANIQRYESEMDQTISDMDGMLGDLGGGAQVSKVNRKNEQVLGNLSAYSATEVKSAADNMSGLLGGSQDAQNLASNASASKILQDQLPAMLRNVEPGQDKSVVVGQLRDMLNQQGIGSGAIDKVLEEIKNRIDKDTNSDGESIGTLIKDIDNNIVDEFSKTAQEGANTLKNLAQTYNNTLQRAIDTQNQYNKVIMESNSYMRKAQTIRINAELDLAQALGKNPTLKEMNKAFDAEITSLTSGLVSTGNLSKEQSSDPRAIAEGIINTSNVNKDLEEKNKTLQNSAGGLTDNPADQEARKKLNREQLDNIATMGKNKVAIEESRQALEKLATDGSKAANALSKIKERQQLGDNVRGLARKILTSDSGELADINRQAGAYSKIINGQASKKELNNLQFRRDAFAGLDNIKSVIPENIAKQMEAKLTRSMLESTEAGRKQLDTVLGVGSDGKEMTLGQSLDMAESGKDPVQEKYIAEYQAATQVQIEANKALSHLAMTSAQSIEKTMGEFETFLNNHFPAIVAKAFADARADAQSKPKPETKSKQENNKEKENVEKQQKELKAKQETLVKEVEALEKERFKNQEIADKGGQGSAVAKARAKDLKAERDRKLAEYKENQKQVRANEDKIKLLAEQEAASSSAQTESKIEAETQQSTSKPTTTQNPATHTSVNSPTSTQTQANVNSVTSTPVYGSTRPAASTTQTKPIQLSPEEEERRNKWQLEQDRRLVTTGEYTNSDHFFARGHMYGGGSIMHKDYEKNKEEDEKLKAKVANGETLSSDEQAKHDEYRRKEKEFYDNRRAQAEANVAVNSGASVSPVAQTQANAASVTSPTTQSKPKPFDITELSDQELKEKISNLRKQGKSGTSTSEYSQALNVLNYRKDERKAQSGKLYANKIDKNKKFRALEQAHGNVESLERAHAEKLGISYSDLLADKEKIGAFRETDEYKAAKDQVSSARSDYLAVKDAPTVGDKFDRYGHKKNTAYEQAQNQKREAYLARFRPEVREKMMTPAEKAAREESQQPVSTGPMVAGGVGGSAYTAATQSQPIPSTSASPERVNATAPALSGPIPTPVSTQQISEQTGGSSIQQTPQSNSATAMMITLDPTALEAMTSFNKTFGNYVTQLANITLPNKIEMTGNHVVDVRISGAAAFDGLKKDFANMVQVEIGKKMSMIWQQSGGKIGEAANNLPSSESGSKT